MSHGNGASRVFRYALAYVVAAALLVPYVWFFFWCKTLFPRYLLHPASFIWLMLIARILLQLVVSLAVLIPAVLILIWVFNKLLTPDELRRLSDKLSD
jgi:hypothetical protein